MTRRFETNRTYVSAFDRHDAEMADFDRKFKRAARFGFAAWAVGAVVMLAFWGAVIWGIVALVQHFTA